MFKDFLMDMLSFDKMITPIVVKVIYYLLLIVVIISAVISMFRGGFANFIGGIIMLIIGPILVRMYCELMILFFRIYDKLKSINEALESQTAEPVQAPQAPADTPE